MNGEKNTIYDDKIVFKKTGKIFTLSESVLKMITDYKIITTDSLKAKLIIGLMNEIHFDTDARGKSLRDRYLIRICFMKRASLTSGLKISLRTIFLSEKINERCNTICLILREKQAGSDANRLDSEIFAIVDKLLAYHTKHFLNQFFTDLNVQIFTKKSC